MKKMLDEFKAFALGGNLVPLAIGFLMATAFAPVVAAFANGVVLNLIARIFGKPNFDSIRLDIGGGDAENGPTYLEFGMVITALVTFLAIAAVCFMIAKAYNRANPPAEEAPAGPSEVELLTEIRDSLRNR